MAVDAAARTDEPALDQLEGRRERDSIDHPERRRAGDEARVETGVAGVALRRVANSRGLVAAPRRETRIGARERRGMDPDPLLPPVRRWVTPEGRDVFEQDLDDRTEVGELAAVPLFMLAERPKVGPVAVELEGGPLRRRLLPVERVPGVQVLAGSDRVAGAPTCDKRTHVRDALAHDTCAPAEEGLRAVDLARRAHRVGDEGAVAEPAVAVRLERRRGWVRAGRRLVTTDDLDAAPDERSRVSRTRSSLPRTWQCAGSRARRRWPRAWPVRGSRRRCRCRSAIDSRRDSAGRARPCFARARTWSSRRSRARCRGRCERGSGPRAPWPSR